jgi:hypothetical protein
VPFLKSNAVGLSTTGIVCTACVVPGLQGACGACASTAGTNAADFGLSVLIELVAVEKADGLLTAAEAKDLVIALKAGQGLLAVGTARGLDRLPAVFKSAVDIVVEAEGVKLIIGYAVDETNKVQLLLKLARPK